MKPYLATTKKMFGLCTCANVLLCAQSEKCLCHADVPMPESQGIMVHVDELVIVVGQHLVIAHGGLYERRNIVDETREVLL